MPFTLLRWRNAAFVGTAVAAAISSCLFAPPAGAAATLPPELAAQVTAGLPPAGPVVSFTGKVPGTNAYLAVVSRGGQVEAYLCDSDKVSAWLTGTLRGSALRAANAKNDVAFTAKRTGSTLAGTLTLAGKSYKVTTKLGSYPAGLYRADYVTTANLYAKTGWIVLPDGTQRGATLVAAAIEAAPNLSTATLQVAVGAAVPAVAVPGDVVAFKAPTQTKKIPTPSPVDMCKSLENLFDMQHDNYLHFNEVGPPSTAAAFGNAMTQTYQKGMALGCAWAPAPGA